MTELLNSLKTDLRKRADDAQKEAGSDLERLAADALARLAGEDSGRLVRWCNWFAKIQNRKLKQPEPFGRWLGEQGELGNLGKRCGVDDVNRLDQYMEDDAKLRIVRDESGKVIEFDLAKEMHLVVYGAAMTDRVCKWEALPSRAKERLLERTAKLARDLAAILDSPGAPQWPMAIDLFDVRNVPRPLRLLLGKHPLSSEMQPLKNQELAPLLRELELWADKEARRPLRDKRKATGSPDARVIARQTSLWFDHRHGSVPDEIVADIVNLVLPDLDPPATGKAVREWRLGE